MKYKNNGQWEEITIKALDSMPIGSIILFAGETIPNGWLICDGRTLYDEEYPDLHNVLGGTGLSFNLPNFKGRVAVGYDSTDTDFNAVGKTGGSKSLPEHAHFIEGNFLKANHSGAGDYYTGENQRFLLAGNRTDNTSEGTGNQGFIANSNLQSRVGTTTAGSGNSGNLQPYLTVNYIIKALNTTPTMASVVNQRNASTEDTYSCDYVNKIGYHLEYTMLGSANNSSPTHTLVNDKLSNYDFLCLVAGYGYNKCSTMTPVSMLPLRSSDFAQMMTLVPTYNSTGWVNINYISDTQFRINCSIGVDTTANVYGVKIVQNN